MTEPGLDRHDWESEWEALEPLVRDSPEEALPELHDLIERMLQERGYLDDNLVATEGADPELLAEYVAGAEIVRRIQAGENVDPGDVGAAVQSYRTLYEHLLGVRAP